jgi:hydroxymethylglutaryl-CoA synthase
MDAAANWIASGLANGKKALVIATDFSRMHFNLKEEFVLGGVATAALVSDEPRVVELELSKKGSWTTNAYDTFRPSATHEVGNNEVSLFTYMDALEGAYTEYLKAVDEPVDFDTYFDYNLYHTPFAGMAFQAHRTLCNLSRPRKKAEVKESFEKKVLPGLRQAQEVGSTYGSSNLLGICSLVTGAEAPTGGERIGFFAYGSGAIGEFYSAIVCPEAQEVVGAMRIDEALSARRAVTVEEYEAIEKLRESYIEQPELTPDRSIPAGWYDAFYRDKGYLVLRQVENFARSYEWS